MVHFVLKHDAFVLKTMNRVLKMMNFVSKTEDQKEAARLAEKRMSVETHNI